MGKDAAQVWQTYSLAALERATAYAASLAEPGEAVYGPRAGIGREVTLRGEAFGEPNGLADAVVVDLDAGLAAVGVVESAAARRDQEVGGSPPTQAVGHHLQVEPAPDPQVHHILVSVGI